MSPKPIDRSPIAATVNAIRNALGLAILGAIGSGFYYGWVAAGVFTAIAVGVAVILEPLLAADWTGYFQDWDEDQEPAITLMDLATRRTIAMTGDDCPERPPNPIVAFTPDVLALLRRSYKYLGEPMGAGADGFQLWLDEFTAWGHQNDCWVAVLPPVLVVAPEPEEPVRGLSA